MPSSIDIARPIAAARDRWSAGLVASLVASLRENSPLIFAVLIYLAGVDGFSIVLGSGHHSFDQIGANYEYFIAISFALFTAAFVVWLLHLTLVRKVSIQTRAAWAAIGGEFFGRDRLLLALPILALWPLLARAFSLMKALIPLAQPFYLDTSLSAWDRALHFGYDPWTLLHPLFGYPVVTFAIDKIYALWFFVMYFAILLQIVATRDRVMRMRFLLASVLAWTLVGGVGATLLSSAGPCYFGAIAGMPDPFAALTSYLRDVDAHGIALFGQDRPLTLIAVRAQDLLWGYYQSGDFGFGHGISAAPSMHVASTWLVARMVQSYGRTAAILGWGFFATILLGSIHLGWHYALDGYIAILGAWIIWRAVGWWLRRPRVRAFLWPQGSTGV